MDWETVLEIIADFYNLVRFGEGSEYDKLRQIAQHALDMRLVVTSDKEAWEKALEKSRRSLGGLEG